MRRSVEPEARQRGPGPGRGVSASAPSGRNEKGDRQRSAIPGRAQPHTNRMGRSFPPRVLLRMVIELRRAAAFPKPLKAEDVLELTAPIWRINVHYLGKHQGTG